MHWTERNTIHGGRQTARGIPVKAMSVLRTVGGCGSLLFSLLFAVSAGSQEIPRFDIRAFRVEGNSILPQATVDALVKPFTGAGKDFGDIQNASEALERAYADQGYTTVSVLLPEQSLDSGEVRLRVIEGRIRSVKVEGATFFDHQNIRASLPGLKEGAIPIMDDLSASLRVANEHPMKKISLRLASGDREEDLDATIAVADDRPWRAGVTLDNTGTEQTGRRRLGFIWQHGNLFGRDHQLSLQYQTSPERFRDVSISAASYRIPLYALGDSIDFIATNSDVNVGTVVAGPISLAVTGKGSAFGVRYNWNLKRRESYEHQVVFGLDEKALKNSLLASGEEFGNNVTVRPLTITYNGRWVQPGEETGYFVSLARNLPGGKNAGQDSITLARVDAPAGFQILRGGLNLNREFADDWQWRLGLSAQWARSPLVPGEQFGLGGSASVRGFEEREFSNDKGFQGNVEVYSPDLCLPMGANCRVLAFYDFGALSRNQPLPGESASEHLASAGIGARYILGKRLTLQADVAQVVDSGANSNMSRGAWKVHARIALLF